FQPNDSASDIYRGSGEQLPQPSKGFLPLQGFTLSQSFTPEGREQLLRATEQVFGYFKQINESRHLYLHVDVVAQVTHRFRRWDRQQQRFRDEVETAQRIYLATLEGHVASLVPLSSEAPNWAVSGLSQKAESRV